MSAPVTDAMTANFVLPHELEAHEPPEARGLARDGVRLLVSRGDTGKTGHHSFADLPDLLRPGDLLVVNDSATLPAAVRLDRLAVHFSTEREDGAWLVELRRRGAPRGRETRVPDARAEAGAGGGDGDKAGSEAGAGGEAAGEPYRGGAPGEWLPLPGGATLRLLERETPRLWRARLDRDVPDYLHRYGVPIRYSYVDRDWPLSHYQTVFGVRPGSAEMPSAGRPFTPELVTRLVTRGIGVVPITLHTGVASPERDEPPYPERFEVPEATARQVGFTRESGGRVIAVGTTVVRALETAALTGGGVGAARGWTSHIVTPSTGVKAVNGLITGLHEPRSSHLLMLSAIAGTDLLSRSYAEALKGGYLWHEFGDLHLIVG
ncbi:S-adenosylmethionine:tRNA ribosyltransferase-isomerase [Streptosporangium carneum]|uniref:S-adenosylmethionine:tRNA ribosyltransferase-isomerase n=1 Tax=Streptosporangium carneum TaxID=47481 RepID=A0A9W6HWP9_9ACTN|nr:S-adenosylmethionine:tRNA ribosyltransferase-isomerase [Streptosporangium carneum]GLK07726.1 S-adenosylmethionine:tRNA ribosyltransferase-isomerase [Streptosporangium carneum]